jgi:hypothetical protein
MRLWKRLRAGLSWKSLRDFHFPTTFAAGSTYIRKTVFKWKIHRFLGFNGEAN